MAISVNSLLSNWVYLLVLESAGIVTDKYPQLNCHKIVGFGILTLQAEGSC